MNKSFQTLNKTIGGIKRYISHFSLLFINFFLIFSTFLFTDRIYIQNHFTSTSKIYITNEVNTRYFLWFRQCILEQKIGMKVCMYYIYMNMNLFLWYEGLWEIYVFEKIFFSCYLHGLILMPACMNKRKFGLFWFYGISTIVGYLMSNSVYTYTLNIWFVNLFLITFLNEHELIFQLEWFQIYLSLIWIILFTINHLITQS